VENWLNSPRIACPWAGKFVPLRHRRTWT